MKRNHGLILVAMAALIALPLVPAAPGTTAAAQSKAVAAPAKHVPTVEDLMALKSAGSPQISPDGTKVAYAVTEADFDQDAYVT
jgi:hypothetical protein